MRWDFKKLGEDVEQDAGAIVDAPKLEAFRIKYLGKKGLLQEIYASLGALTPEEKPLVGKGVNDLKGRINEILELKKNEIQRSAGSGGSKLDVTIPGVTRTVGHAHLLSQTINEICSIFERMGFVVKEGPEIETEFHNFTALNIPADHPSRDGFDTFYLDVKNTADRSNLLLRSHTSPGQIRIMKEFRPPLAVVIPGKVYRPDAVDASHSFMFHQIEGLLVDEDVKFSDLKGLLLHFCRELFGPDIEMRFRPHFFPFTEPSAEVDISWKGGKKKWLEIMGCGMVNPKVFEFCGYPKGKYTGLAFGMGVERMAMLRHGINDIRLFYDNDKRFLSQF